MALDDAGTLHVAWVDQTGAPGVRYARSFDQGRTFTSAGVLSTGSGFLQRPRLAIHGTAVYVVWMQDVGDNNEIFFTRSSDSGATFEPPRNISNTLGQSREARIAVNAAGTIFAVWDEETPSRHIAIARSNNGGATFTIGTVAPLVRAMTDCPADASPSSCTAYPGVAADPRRPNNLYVTWHDNPGGKLDVFFTRSTDGGASFGLPRNISNAPVHAHCASLTVGPSGRILVSFESRKQPPPADHRHNSDVVQSTDGGANFTPAVDVSNSPVWALSDYPWSVEGPDGTIVTGYEDNAEGGELSAVVQMSKNGGSSFGPRHVIDPIPSGTQTEVVTLFDTDGTLYVAWEDHRGGSGESAPGEIFIARAPGASAPGNPPLMVALAANQPS